MKHYLTLCSIVLGSLSSLLAADSLKPILCEKGDIIFTADFSDGLIPEEWVASHGTQWKAVDGVLLGNPSSQEYKDKRKQAGKTKHMGGTPSSSVMVPIKDGIIQLSFKISGKMSAAHQRRVGQIRNWSRDALCHLKKRRPRAHQR
jgi:hypothetical protein